MGNSINFTGLQFQVYDGGFVSTNWVNVEQLFHGDFYILNAQTVGLFALLLLEFKSVSHWKLFDDRFVLLSLGLWVQ